MSFLCISIKVVFIVLLIFLSKIYAQNKTYNFSSVDKIIEDEKQQALALPAIVGEWSLGLDLKVVSLWAQGPYNHALERMDAFQERMAYRAYAAAQLLSFEHYRGWFFWSYRTETTPAWCFRDCVERGWLPERFD